MAAGEQGSVLEHERRVVRTISQELPAAGARPAAERAALLLRRADAYAAMGDRLRALRDVRDALRLAPQRAPLLVRAARIFLATGYADKAERVLQAAERHSIAPEDQENVANVRTAVAAAATEAGKSASDTPMPSSEPSAGPSAERGSPPPHSRAPREVMLRVFAWLDLASLHSCAQVCRAWRACVTSSPQLWHTIAVPEAPPTPSRPLRRSVQQQAALLDLLCRRAGAHLRRVELAAPLSETEVGFRMLERAARALTALTVQCTPEQAARWTAWSAHVCESLEHLRIDAVREPRTPRGAATHPWLAPPVRLPEDAPLRTLALRGTPPLAADARTLVACAALTHLVVDAGTGGGAALRAVQERCSGELAAVVYAARGTLEELQLDGDAVWRTDFFGRLGAEGHVAAAFAAGDAPPGDAPPGAFPRLRRLSAPLKSVLHTPAPVPVLAERFPALEALEVQLAPSRAPGRSPDTLLALAAATADSVRELCIRAVVDTPVGLVAELLRAWRGVRTLTLRIDEAAADDAPAWGDVQAHPDRPLTAPRLARLLTPQAEEQAVLCPELERLRFVADGSLRGRELAELVAVRRLLSEGRSVTQAWAQVRRPPRGGTPSQPATPVHSEEDGSATPAPTARCCALEQLDVDECLELDPQVIPYLQRHVPHLTWHAQSAARERLRARQSQGPRGYAERLRGA